MVAVGPMPSVFDKNELEDASDWISTAFGAEVCVALTRSMVPFGGGPFHMPEWPASPSKSSQNGAPECFAQNGPEASTLTSDAASASPASLVASSAPTSAAASF